MANLYQLDIQTSAQKAGDGSEAAVVTLGGVLDFDSVPEILQKVEPVVGKHSNVTIDLAAVSSANSAALALLVELRKNASAIGHSLQFQAVPASIIKIAEVCEADSLLTAG